MRPAEGPLGRAVALMTTSALVASGALVFATAPVAAHARTRTARVAGAAAAIIALATMPTRLLTPRREAPW